MSAIRNVIIRLDGHEPRHSELITETVDSSVRIIRAMKSMGIFWSCAFVAIFVPMLHFVLVPAFLLAGLFFAANSYYDQERVKLGSPVNCLKCQGQVALANDSDVFPKWGRCDKCQTEYRFDLNKE